MFGIQRDAHKYVVGHLMGTKWDTCIFKITKPIFLNNCAKAFSGLMS